MRTLLALALLLVLGLLPACMDDLDLLTQGDLAFRPDLGTITDAQAKDFK